jgi:hypothetical protein
MLGRPHCGVHPCYPLQLVLNWTCGKLSKVYLKESPILLQEISWVDAQGGFYACQDCLMLLQRHPVLEFHMDSGVLVEPLFMDHLQKSAHKALGPVVCIPL